MRRLVWTVAWVCVAVWSLFSAAAYGVFNLVGGWASRNADLFASDPQSVEWVWRIFSSLHSLSTGAVLVGWGLVSLMILAVPWVLDRAAATSTARTTVMGDGRSHVRGDGAGVIELSPDQYSVGTPPRAAGPASRTNANG